jgi:hypothetical protein
VVALDDVTIATTRLDPVGRDGALNEIFSPAVGLFILKNPNELLTDDMELGLGVGDTFEIPEEAF